VESGKGRRWNASGRGVPGFGGGVGGGGGTRKMKGYVFSFRDRCGRWKRSLHLGVWGKAAGNQKIELSDSFAS